MERAQLEIISLNASMAEHSEKSLLDRQEAMNRATQELTEAYVAGRPPEAPVPDQLDDAAAYAAGLLYRVGSPAFHPDDINRALENDLSHLARKQPEAAAWVKASKENRELVVELFIQASLLALEDKQPAYTPHIDGRPPEILDPAGTKYNKYGVLIY